MPANIKPPITEKVFIFLTILLALISVSTKNLVSDDHIGLLIVLWFIYKFGYQKIPLKPEISKHKTWLIILFSFLVLSLIPIAFHSGYTIRTFNALNDYSAAFVLATTLTLLLASFRLDRDFFWYLILSASLIVLYIIIKETYIVGFNKVLSSNYRFGEIAGTHIIDFGWFSNSLFVILLGIFPWARSKGHLTLFLSILSLLVCFVGAVLSEARTAWIGWPIAFLIWSVYYVSIWQTPFKSLKVSGAISLIALVGYLLWQQPLIGGEIEKRALLTFKSIDKYGNNNPNTSFGKRFVMYEIAIDQVKKTPILGIGHDHISDFINKNSRELYKNKFNLESEGLHYAHIHNQFLMALLTGGIIALSGLLILVIGVTYFLYKGARDSNYKNTIWLAGLVFMITSVFTFLPETPFHTKTRFLLFMIILSVFMAVVKSEDRN